MRVIDYHMHTHFSGDSEANPREHVLKAIEMNLDEICFTDHRDFDYPIDSFELDVENYYQEIQSLKEEFKDQIKIKWGIEMGLDLDHQEEIENLIQQYPFDLVIGSIHVIHHTEFYYGEFFKGKTKEQAHREFFEETLKCVKAFDCFNVLGHLDYIVRYGPYEDKTVDHQKYQDIMDEILQYIQSYLRKYRVSIYDRKRHKGLLRHVLIRRGVKTNQAMVVLVCNENMWRGSKQFCSQLVKKFPSIKTIVLNVNTRKTPIVLGNEDKVLYGKGFIVDELCGLKFKISPQSFYQINHDQCVNLYTKALSLLNIKGNETAIDAYCGIGTIGMILSQKVKQVIGVESNKDAIKDAKNNARMNQLSNIQFVCDDATEFMKKLAKEKHKVDVVIMDPPRSGSTKQFMDSVKILNPKQVVYISCDPTTQIRDIQYFKKIGYHTHTMYLYDMFPHTRHVETVCLLSRKDK